MGTDSTIKLKRDLISAAQELPTGEQPAKKHKLSEKTRAPGPVDIVMAFAATPEPVDKTEETPEKGNLVPKGPDNLVDRLLGLDSPDNAIDEHPNGPADEVPKDPAAGAAQQVEVPKDLIEAPQLLRPAGAAQEVDLRGSSEVPKDLSEVPQEPEARSTRGTHQPAEKHKRDRKNCFITDTLHCLEDAKGQGELDWERMGIGKFTPSHMLDSVLDPSLMMNGIWKELSPKILKMLNFLDPLKFGVNDDWTVNSDDRAYCAPWNKDHAAAAFKGPGHYLSSCCFHWLDVKEQPGEFSSWRNIVQCAQTFWQKPNPDSPHLTGWVGDASIFEMQVPPYSIKLRGSYELVSALGLQLSKLTDDQLLAWKPCLRSIVITVYQESSKNPLKGLQIKQATELSVREKTQEVLPIQQAIMINDMLDLVPGAKNGMKGNLSNDKIAAFFK